MRNDALVRLVRNLDWFSRFGFNSAARWSTPKKTSSELTIGAALVLVSASRTVGQSAEDSLKWKLRDRHNGNEHHDSHLDSFRVSRCLDHIGSDLVEKSVTIHEIAQGCHHNIDDELPASVAL